MYLTGTEAWTNAFQQIAASTDSYYLDTNGNKVFMYSLSSGQNVYTFTAADKVNLFTLGVGAEDKPLCAQDFIFWASDGKKNTVKSITLAGDSTSPVLTFDKIKITMAAGVEQEKNINETPVFDSRANGKKAVISGTWSDTFNSEVSNTEKFYSFTVTWNNGNANKVERKPGGIWEATFDNAPRAGGTITASIRDMGGNEKTIQGAARIETSDLSLSSIGCEQDDGYYKEDAVHPLQITLVFPKRT